MQCAGSEETMIVDSHPRTGEASFPPRFPNADPMVGNMPSMRIYHVIEGQPPIVIGEEWLVCLGKMVAKRTGPKTQDERTRVHIEISLIRRVERITHEIIGEGHKIARITKSGTREISREEFAATATPVKYRVNGSQVLSITQVTADDCPVLHMKPRFKKTKDYRAELSSLSRGRLGPKRIDQIMQAIPVVPPEIEERLQSKDAW